MSRSLLILVVTVIVVAASYYGFSRFASTSGPAVGASGPSSPQPADAMSGAAANVDPTPAASVTPGPAREASSTPGASSDSAATAAPAAAAPPPPAAGTPAPSTFTIAIDKAHPPAPSDVIRVHKDDPVTLSITSDRAGHLEVHGYRKEVQVAPGRTSTLSFTAARTGRFPIDLHGSDGAHVEVTALEVLPK